MIIKSNSSKKAFIILSIILNLKSLNININNIDIYII